MSDQAGNQVQIWKTLYILISQKIIQAENQIEKEIINDKSNDSDKKNVTRSMILKNL